MTSKKMAVGLTCCYFKHLGWPARQIMTNPILTAVIGAYMDTKLSTRRISGFIRANALDMSDYIKQDYRCFNDFFTRQVKAGARPALVAYLGDNPPMDLVKRIGENAFELLRKENEAHKDRVAICYRTVAGVTKFADIKQQIDITYDGSSMASITGGQ